jgi:hypothetical protein
LPLEDLPIDDFLEGDLFTNKEFKYDTGKYIMFITPKIIIGLATKMLTI